MIPLEATLRETEWLILKGSVAPLIVMYAFPSWTSIAARRYPDHVVLNLCAMYVSEDGAKGTFGVEKKQYFDSAKKLLAEPEELTRIFKDFDADEAAFHAAVAALPQELRALEAQITPFLKAYDDMYSSGIIIDGFLAYSETFVGEMRAKYPSADEEIRTLTAPYGLTFMQKEEFALAELAVGLAERTVSAEEEAARLEDIRSRFHYVQNSYRSVQGLPLSYFQERLDELLHKDPSAVRGTRDTLGSHEARHQAACEAIRTSDAFSAEDFERLLWIGKIAWWVDRRKACNLIANHHLGRYIEAVAARLGMPYEELVYLLPSEFEAVRNGEKKLADVPIAERRKDFGYIYTSAGAEYALMGEDAQTLRDIIDPPLTALASEARGVVACKGRATGRARVVFDPHEEAAFAEGDILIASMTRPDFLGLMRKAAAFVTDEGGITCHAAIVAREMGKPCVIGTRVATKIFQDGDMVEVDAERGIVRKL